MSHSNPLGLTPVPRKRPGPQRAGHVLVRGPLAHVLAFTGRTIDDVVNSPVVKNEVLGYYKLQKWITRGGEIADLERQWNGLRL